MRDFLVIDSETKDSYLKKYGSGAVFKYHYPSVPFEVLCFSAYDGNDMHEFNFTEAVKPKEQLLELIQTTDTLVMHNASYDLGVLKYLYRDELDFSKYRIHDTMLMAKLIDQQIDERSNNRKGYSLDNLGDWFKLDSRKGGAGLDDYAWYSGTYQSYHKLSTGRNCNTRPSERVLHDWVMENLHLLDIKEVIKYCSQDVMTTYELYVKLLELLGGYDLTQVSDIVKIVLKMKFRGLTIDLKSCEELRKDWEILKEDSAASFLKAIGADDTININSTDQIAPLLIAKGIQVPKTKKDNYSIDKKWLESQNNPILDPLELYRKAEYAIRYCIGKIFKYQEAIPIEDRKEGIGRVFPTYKVLGATLTGRFSSGGGQGCCELNMLGIGGRDEQFGIPLRKIFIPNSPDNKIICADFKAQEPRLQIHYAKLLQCPGIDSVVKAYNDDPMTDYHTLVAEMTQLPRKQAKIVNLGLAYDMTKYGLSKQLKCSVPEAEKVVNQYYRLLPFLKPLQQICAANLKKLGYIKTIGGRKLLLDPPTVSYGKLKTYEKKGLSKLIQGSGLDQLWRAMIELDKLGMMLLIPAHDEIVAESVNPESDVKVLQDVMENAYKLVIPVVAEIGYGDNWFQSKP